MRALSGDEGPPLAHCSTICGSSMNSGTLGSGARYIKWACIFSSGVYPDCKWVRRTASSRFEVVLRSSFQEKLSYTMTIWGLLGEGPVIVRRMLAFMMANAIGRGKVSVMAVA